MSQVWYVRVLILSFLLVCLAVASSAYPMLDVSNEDSYADGSDPEEAYVYTQMDNTDNLNGLEWLVQKQQKLEKRRW